MLELALSFDRIRSNEQYERNSQLFGDSPQTHEVVGVTIIKSKHDRRGLQITGIEQSHSFCQAHNSVMSEQESDQIPKSLCGYAHAVRTIGYKMMSKNGYWASATQPTVPVASGDEWREEHECFK